MERPYFSPISVERPGFRATVSVERPCFLVPVDVFYLNKSLFSVTKRICLALPYRNSDEFHKMGDLAVVCTKRKGEKDVGICESVYGLRV